MAIEDIPILVDNMIKEGSTDQLRLDDLQHNDGGQIDIQDPAIGVYTQIAHRRKIVKILKLVDSLQKRI